MLIRPSCSSNRCSTTNHRDNSRRTRYTHSKPRTLRRARSRSRFRLDQRRNRKCILSRSQRLLPDELRRAHIPPTRALELSRCKRPFHVHLPVSWVPPAWGSERSKPHVSGPWKRVNGTQDSASAVGVVTGSCVLVDACMELLAGAQEDRGLYVSPEAGREGQHEFGKRVELGHLTPRSEKVSGDSRVV
jgi:hypothetical protein